MKFFSERKFSRENFFFDFLTREEVWVLRVSEHFCRSLVCCVSAISHAMYWGEFEGKMRAHKFFIHFSFIFIQFVIKKLHIVALCTRRSIYFFAHWRSLFVLSLIPLKTKFPHSDNNFFFSSLQYIYRQIHDFITCIMNNNITICKK